MQTHDTYIILDFVPPYFVQNFEENENPPSEEWWEKSLSQSRDYVLPGASRVAVGYVGGVEGGRWVD